MTNLRRVWLYSTKNKKVCNNPAICGTKQIKENQTSIKSILLLKK